MKSKGKTKVSSTIPWLYAAQWYISCPYPVFFLWSMIHVTFVPNWEDWRKKLSAKWKKNDWNWFVSRFLGQNHWHSVVFQWDNV